MHVYLTFADQPSGVYRSQVEDFVNFINDQTETDIKLIALISFRNFFSNRNLIRNRVNNAIVLPMWPRLQNWLFNRYTLYVLFFFIRPKIVIARGVLAAYLALKCKEKNLAGKVVYDGRGAIGAEWMEYQVVQNKWLRENVGNWEGKVVHDTDFRIAVSNKLVQYWEKQYNFTGDRFRVIPCTLDKSYENLEFNIQNRNEIRRKLGFKPDDIILVYSGSVAGWQSSKLLSDYLENQLNRQPGLSVLFLSRETEEIVALKSKFPGKIVSVFLQPAEVPPLLLACDYGLLIRESSVTNEVASPVKFAEYLSCGLKVIISPGIGDYSQMVELNEIGLVYSQENIFVEPVSIEDKNRCRGFALEHFTKGQFKNIYLSIFRC